MRIPMLIGSSLVMLSTSLAAQNPTAVTCDAVMAAPTKFVGRSVVFYGSLAGGEFRPINGKSVSLSAWACKSMAGVPIPKGKFGLVESESTFTQAAGKANTATELFRISGVVGQVNTVSGESMPFLTKARIELASEAK
jgi:hypothetical protein